MSPEKTKNRGRPEIIPWDNEMKYLISARKEGATYADLAYELTLKYERSITPQTVRSKISPLMSRSAEAKAQKIRAEERQGLLDDEAYQIAVYIVENQQSSKEDVAEGLDIPLYRVDMLYSRAKESMDGYIIPAVRKGKEKFTSDQMESTLRSAAKAMGLSKNGHLSEGAFKKWRDSFAPAARNKIPNPMVYRRRYGTWTDACAAAGLQANPLPRNYDGVSTEDCVVWLAHWLRSLTNRREGLIEASQGEYMMWLQENPDAPSQEMLRLRGAWNVLLAAASTYEQTHKKLPAPKPVQTSYRKKKKRS